MEPNGAPPRFDFVGIIGDDLLVEVTLRDAASVPLDLTGATIEVFMEEAGVVKATPTPTITDATGGVYQFELSDTATAELEAKTLNWHARVVSPWKQTVTEGLVTWRAPGRV